MTLSHAELFLDADVDNDGTLETGRFVLKNNVELQPQIRTGDLVGQAGSNALSIVDYWTGGEQGRAGVNIDFGGGAFVIDISFSGFEGDSDSQWGDGSDNAKADATGASESVFRKLSVLFRYLNVGEFDSRNPAVVHWGEFYPDGVYDPLEVTVEEPTASFAAEEQSSMFDGSVTLVSIRSLESIASASQQQDEK